MSDDVRMAAGRVYGRWDDLRMRSPEDIDQLLVDAATVATAYLIEHPADDGEPVSEDWLRAVGFDPHPNLSFWLQRATFQIRLGLYVAKGRVRINGEDSNARAETRGEVRRLCTALSIPLTEPAP